MRLRVWGVEAICCAVLLTSSPAVAHHFFPHDTDKPISLVGAVTRFEWVNPHALLYLDIKDQDTGTVTNWQIELGNPFALTRRGWTIDSLKFGDVVTVGGFLYPAKVNRAVARDVRLPDGRTLVAGSHAGDPQP